MRLRLPVGAIAVVLLLSCGAPFYYERARFEPGTSFGLGVGAGTGEAANGSSMSTHLPYYDYYCAGFGTAFLRHAPTDRTCFFFQGSVGTGKWLTRSGDAYSRPVTGELQGGIKFRIGPRGALRLSCGLPSLLDAVYLHDLTDFLTVNAGLGFRGASLGAGFHTRLGERLLGHLTLACGVTRLNSSYTLPGTAAAGVGLELTPPRRRGID